MFILLCLYYLYSGVIFYRDNACNAKLQSVQIDLGIEVEIYQSLIDFLNDIRTDQMFIDYKTRAVNKCDISHFKISNQRKKKRNRFFDENNSEEHVFDEFEYFMFNTYFYILDQIKSELEKKKTSYVDLTFKYNFFFSFNGTNTN